MKALVVYYTKKKQFIRHILQASTILNNSFGFLKMFNAIEFLAQANQYAPQTMMHFKIQCFYTTGM